MPQPLDGMHFAPGHSSRTAGRSGKGGGTGTLEGCSHAQRGPVALDGAASSCLWPHQVCALGNSLAPPGAAIGLHGTESPSNEQRNKSYKAGRDLLDFNILEIMRTFLLPCNITGPNRITTRIYPHAFPWCWVGFYLWRSNCSSFQREAWQGIAFASRKAEVERGPRAAPTVAALFISPFIARRGLVLILAPGWAVPPLLAEPQTPAPAPTTGTRMPGLGTPALLVPHRRSHKPHCTAGWDAAARRSSGRG